MSAPFERRPVSRSDMLLALRGGFPNVDDAELNTLCDLATTCTYPPNTRLVHEDAIEDTFYFIIKGEVSVTVCVGDNAEHELTRRIAGQFFGEMALIDRGPRSASVTTLTETTALELSSSNFVSALALCPHVTVHIMQHIVSQLRNAVEENARYYEAELSAAREREKQLAQQVEMLRIQIDQARLQLDVHKVTDTDYFRDLQGKAGAMRERLNRDSPDRKKP